MEMECPNCGQIMIRDKQPGGYYRCPDCHMAIIAKYGKVLDILNGPDAPEGYDDYYDDDDGPGEGCRACGNPNYPNCLDSCPMGDD